MRACSCAFSLRNLTSPSSAASKYEDGMSVYPALRDSSWSTRRFCSFCSFLLRLSCSSCSARRRSSSARQIASTILDGLVSPLKSPSSGRRYRVVCAVRAVSKTPNGLNLLSHGRSRRSTVARRETVQTLPTASLRPASKASLEQERMSGDEGISTAAIWDATWNLLRGSKVPLLTFWGSLVDPPLRCEARKDDAGISTAAIWDATGSKVPLLTFWHSIKQNAHNSARVGGFRGASSESEHVNSPSAMDGQLDGPMFSRCGPRLGS